jgi:hypothetical protein
VELCEERYRPHDVHSGGGKDEGGTPDTVGFVLAYVLGLYHKKIFVVLGGSMALCSMMLFLWTGRAKCRMVERISVPCSPTSTQSSEHVKRTQIMFKPYLGNGNA